MKPAGKMEGYKKVCPICGKEFWAMSNWVYKQTYKGHNKTYYCSYKCIRKEQKENHKNEKIQSSDSEFD